MTSERISEIIKTARTGLIDIIREHLADKPTRSQEIHVELPNTWDEDNYYTEILTSVSIGEDGVVYVTTTSDLEDAEVSTDEIVCFSLDEIIKIIDAL